jgi:hypothetical protein
VPGDPARASEGRHPPGPQALQRPGVRAGRQAGGQGDRLRYRQGDGAEVDGLLAVHRAGRRDRHPGLHVPRAGRARSGSGTWPGGKRHSRFPDIQGG